MDVSLPDKYVRIGKHMVIEASEKFLVKNINRIDEQLIDMMEQCPYTNHRNGKVLLLLLNSSNKKNIRIVEKINNHCVKNLYDIQKYAKKKNHIKISSKSKEKVIII